MQRNVTRMTIRDELREGEVLASDLLIGDRHQNVILTGTEERPDGIVVTIWRDAGDRQDIAVITFYPGSGIDVHNTTGM